MYQIKLFLCLMLFMCPTELMSSTMKDAAESPCHEIKAAIGKARCCLPAVRYNERMLQFLCEQLEQVEHLLPHIQQDPSSPSTELQTLQQAVKRASTLMERHTKVLDFSSYYKPNVVHKQVEALCAIFADCFQDLGIQERLAIKTVIDKTHVKEDTRYVHWYLECILRGRRGQRRLPEDLQKELEEQIISQRQRLQVLKLLNDDDVQCTERIGRGSFGDVFKGSWKGRPVAVKKFHQELTLEVEAAFFTEVELHCKMNHPNVVFCHGALSSPGIVMEMADTDLKKYLSNNGGDLDLPSKLKLMVSSSLGIMYLHDSENIVHRDIKSSNFLVFGAMQGCRPMVKITDFGMATVKIWSSRSDTPSPTLGSLLWMAPELFDGAPHSKRSDVFSLGIVLFEIAAVDTPYRNLNGDPQILKTKKEMKDPCYIPSEFPGDVLQLMRKCIHAEAQMRPTMAEVVRQLNESLEKVSIMGEQ